MKNILFYIYLLGGIISCPQLLAQLSPQFSTFYNAPTLHNPAFTGQGNGNLSATLVHRNQWQALGGFNVSGFGIDAKAGKGIGLGATVVTNHLLNQSHLKYTSLSGLIGYEIHLGKKRTSRRLRRISSPRNKTRRKNQQRHFKYQIIKQKARNRRKSSGKKHVLSFGMSATWETIQVNAQQLTFPSQFNNQGQKISNVSGENFLTDRLSYVNLSAGLLYIQQNFWLAVSSHHLNRPQASFFDNTSRIQPGMTVQTGLRIPVNDVLQVTPIAHFKKYGALAQLDVGSYVFYNKPVNSFANKEISNMGIGLFYRGIPTKNQTENPLTFNHDALILTAGLTYGNFTISYARDFTISRIAHTGGGHEIAVTLKLSSSKEVRTSPCPVY